MKIETGRLAPNHFFLLNDNSKSQKPTRFPDADTITLSNKAEYETYATSVDTSSLEKVGIPGEPVDFP